MKQYIQHAIKTPDGHILNETNGKNNEVYRDSNGESYHVFKKNNIIKATSLFIDKNESFNEIREKLLWGTYGKSGKDKFSWIILKNMTKEHLRNIIDTQKQINEYHRNFFQKELIYRNTKEF